MRKIKALFGCAVVFFSAATYAQNAASDSSAKLAIQSIKNLSESDLQQSSFGRDPFGRISTITFPGVTLTYSYDGANKHASSVSINGNVFKLPNKTKQYTYDQMQAIEKKFGLPTHPQSHMELLNGPKFVTPNEEPTDCPTCEGDDTGGSDGGGGGSDPGGGAPVGGGGTGGTSYPSPESDPISELESDAFWSNYFADYNVSPECSASVTVCTANCTSQAQGSYLFCAGVGAYVATKNVTAGAVVLGICLLGAKSNAQDCFAGCTPASLCQ